MWELFITFFKIGAFTFGGGYVMLPLMEEFCVEKHNWITHDEFMNTVVIAESTPGPIAINLATYCGYKRKGLLGALVATLGVVLPSLIVIYIISLFFDSFIQNKYVSYAFYGIRIAVSIIIVDVSIKLLHKELKIIYDKKEKTIFILIYTIVFLLYFVSMWFSLGISLIHIIVASIILGVILCYI